MTGQKLRTIKTPDGEYISLNDLRDLLKRLQSGHEPKLVHTLMGMMVLAHDKSMPPNLIIGAVVGGFLIFGAGLDPEVPQLIIPGRG